MALSVGNYCTKFVLISGNESNYLSQCGVALLGIVLFISVFICLQHWIHICYLHVCRVQAVSLYVRAEFARVSFPRFVFIEIVIFLIKFTETALSKTLSGVAG